LQLSSLTTKWAIRLNEVQHRRAQCIRDRAAAESEITHSSAVLTATEAEYDDIRRSLGLPLGPLPSAPSPQSRDGPPSEAASLLLHLEEKQRTRAGEVARLSKLLTELAQQQELLSQTEDVIHYALRANRSRLERHRRKLESDRLQPIAGDAASCVVP